MRLSMALERECGGLVLGRVAVGERMLTLPVHWPHAAPSLNTIHLPKSSFPSLHPGDDTVDGRNTRLHGDIALDAASGFFVV